MVSSSSGEEKELSKRGMKYGHLRKKRGVQEEGRGNGELRYGKKGWKEVGIRVGGGGIRKGDRERRLGQLQHYESLENLASHSFGEILWSICMKNRGKCSLEAPGREYKERKNYL